MRQIVKGVVDRLLPEPLLKVANAPKSLMATVTRQYSEKRTLLHLLNYIGRRNNHTCDTIEEIIPLHGVEISLRAEGPVTSVRAVPEDQALPFARAEGRITFTLPTLHGYQMIEVT